MAGIGLPHDDLSKRYVVSHIHLAVAVHVALLANDVYF